MTGLVMKREAPAAVARGGVQQAGATHGLVGGTQAGTIMGLLLLTLPRIFGSASRRSARQQQQQQELLQHSKRQFGSEIRAWGALYLFGEAPTKKMKTVL